LTTVRKAGNGGNLVSGFPSFRWHIHSTARPRLFALPVAIYEGLFSRGGGGVEATFASAMVSVVLFPRMVMIWPGVLAAELPLAGFQSLRRSLSQGEIARSFDGRCKMRGLIASLVIVMLGSGELQATTVYDAAADLTETSIDNGINPNGVWSYGYRNTAASTEFNLLTNYGQFPAYEPGFTGLKGWFDQDYGDFGLLPVVVKNTTDSPLIGGGYNEITVPPGGLMLHSGEGVDDSYAVLRWTAPASVTADLAVAFTGLGYDPEISFWTTTDVHVVKNGMSLFDAEVTGGLPASTNVQSYSVHGMAVVAGDTIDFIVGPGPGGNFLGDSTGVDVQITVPEPSSLILFSIAAISFLACRRRRRAS
jgi:hypothetical protein